jgi:hypothetical protein
MEPNRPDSTAQSTENTDNKNTQCDMDGKCNIIEVLGTNSETTDEWLGINEDEDKTEHLQLYLIPSPNPDSSECHIFVLGTAERLHYVSSFDLTDFDGPNEYADLFEAHPPREADERQ